MKNRRLILLLCMVATGTFASFFGGSFSHALFYACFSIPISCLIYIIFIYFRLKIYQSIETKITVKGDTIPYKFMLVNEDYIYCRKISTEFISDYSKIDIDELNSTVSLKPNERIVQETGLTCLYRGEYRVGIKSILITDYLGLFCIKRKYPSEMLVRVYPRVVKLENLNVLSLDENAKTSPFSFSSKKEIPDSELREYISGDNPRSVNWKVSAKQNKLFVRKYTELPKQGVEIYLDLSAVNEKYGNRLVLEDKLLETALAIADYYLQKKINSGINYYTKKHNEFKIDTTEGFSEFYESCLDLNFDSDIEFGKYIKENIIRKNTSALTILLTAKINSDLYDALSVINNPSAVILIGNHKNISEIYNNLSKVKSILVHIPENSKIRDRLTS